MEDNRLSSSVGEDLAQLITETSIEVLNLGSNQLGDEGVEAIAGALSGKISGGRFRPTAELAAGVRLTRLDVSRNSVGSKGFQAMISALSVNHTVRNLEIGGNDDIGPGIAASTECAGCIASSLLAAQGLEELHLWKCGLADAAYDLIAESLPPNIAVANLATNNFSANVRDFILESQTRCGVIRL